MTFLNLKVLAQGSRREKDWECSYRSLAYHGEPNMINDLKTVISMGYDLFYHLKTLAEEMIRGLTKLSWERVDVNFSGSMQRLVAHSTIQVNWTFS